ncbi:type VII secretion system-associated protein [Nocardia sp. NPDC057440]|uniref:type VII secretion system-associated protein n=1 Tax=Nocardia sp. NPDC057440 TaxID=3346134 RepID=UPI00366FA2A6
MDQQASRVIRHGESLVLTAPGWEASKQPPPEAIVGRWIVDQNGNVGPFQPNPDYLPTDDATPTDPLDAILRLIAEGDQQLIDEFVSTLCHSIVEVGCDKHNRPVTSVMPDDTVCIVIVTAQAQKVGVEVDHWWPMVGSDLPEIAPAGTGILFNPNGCTSLCLVADALTLPGPERRR